jgi:hypothetical protein
MKAANILSVGLMAVALTGCGAVNYASNVVSPRPGYSVEFVSANNSSVLVDYGNRPANELQYATAMAKDKCAIFDKPTAVLESLNPRGDGETRATYICK